MKRIKSVIKNSSPVEMGRGCRIVSRPFRLVKRSGRCVVGEGGDAEQVEGAVLCAGRGGENRDEAIAPETDDIAGERGELAEQGVKAVHRERFAICGLGSGACSPSAPCKAR
jgi:hypothetical protein